MARNAGKAAEGTPRPLFEIATRGDVQISRGGQSVTRVEYLDLRCAPTAWAHVGDGEIKPYTHRIRLTIHTDQVSAQAFARAERWNGEQWHTVHETAGELLRAVADLAVIPGSGPHGGPTHAEYERKLQPARAALLEQLEAAIGF